MKRLHTHSSIPDLTEKIEIWCLLFLFLLHNSLLSRCRTTTGGCCRTTASSGRCRGSPTASSAGCLDQGSHALLIDHLAKHHGPEGFVQSHICSFQHVGHSSSGHFTTLITQKQGCVSACELVLLTLTQLCHSNIGHC